MLEIKAKTIDELIEHVARSVRIQLTAALAPTVDRIKETEAKATALEAKLVDLQNQIKGHVELLNQVQADRQNLLKLIAGAANAIAA